MEMSVSSLEGELGFQQRVLGFSSFLWHDSTFHSPHDQPQHHGNQRRGDQQSAEGESQWQPGGGSDASNDQHDKPMWTANEGVHLPDIKLPSRTVIATRQRLRFIGPPWA